MKTLYKNKTKYTKELYSKFLEFHRAKNGLKYHSYTAIISALILFCLIINLRYNIIFLALVFTIILAVFIWYRMFYPNKKVNKEVKKEKFEKEKEFTFSFYEDYITIDDGQKKQKYSYWKFYKIYQNDSYFYLYISKEYAFILDKKQFLVGDVKTFYKFIKKKTWVRIFKRNK